MHKIRILPLIKDSGAMQMAIDEAILVSRAKCLVPDTLRFFTWEPSAITIGFFQSLDKEVDVNKAKELNIDIVRRYTGGGAVLHDKELTYSIAISEDNIKGDIIKSYEIICNGIIKGLNKLGLDSKFKPINDIIVNEKKISGNAQTRKQGVILQHGTILMDVDVRKMFSLLKVCDEKIKDKMIEIVEERVTSLKHVLQREISVEELKNYLIEGFGESLNCEFVEGELTDEEINLAKKLYDEKYNTKEWCYFR